MNGNEIKLVTFADDMTSFVRDKQSHLTLLDVIKSFGRYSGSMINQYRMEAFYLEIINASNSLGLETIEIKNPLKFWGFTSSLTVYFFYKFNIESTENFERYV